MDRIYMAQTASGILLASGIILAALAAWLFFHFRIWQYFQLLYGGKGKYHTGNTGPLSRREKAVPDDDGPPIEGRRITGPGDEEAAAMVLSQDEKGESDSTDDSSQATPPEDTEDDGSLTGVLDLSGEGETGLLGSVPAIKAVSEKADTAEDTQLWAPTGTEIVFMRDYDIHLISTEKRIRDFPV